jgi:hypothetical protein
VLRRGERGRRGIRRLGTTAVVVSWWAERTREESRTDPFCVVSFAGIRIIRVVKTKDILEDDDPADPATGGVKGWLDGVLDGIVELNPGLDFLGDVTPGSQNGEAENGRHDIDDDSESPGDDEVCGSPEEPSLDILLDVQAVVGRILAVPEEMDENGRSDEDGSEEGGTDERGEQESDDSGESEEAARG